MRWEECESMLRTRQHQHHQLPPGKLEARYRWTDERERERQRERERDEEKERGKQRKEEKRDVPGPIDDLKSFMRKRGSSNNKTASQVSAIIMALIMIIISL